MSADKEQATRLADALRQSFPAFGDGTRSDRERLAVDAAALLERWPDAVEPVARVSWNDIGHISWRTNVMLPDGTPLYTAPPDQSERIAALEDENAKLPCGHPASMMLMSAETGEPLYCEACDDKSGRRDAERVEAEQRIRIAALERKGAERKRPTVAIGAKASEWKTLSPQAQALIQQAAQKAVDRWSEQQKLDGAARAATPLVPLGASDLDRAHGGIDDRIAALEAALAERDRVIEQARVALEGLLRGCKRSTIQGLTGWHEKSMPSSEALDAGQDALRKIEEVQK